MVQEDTLLMNAFQFENCFLYHSHGGLLDVMKISSAWQNVDPPLVCRIYGYLSHKRNNCENGSHP